jgi:hypothetical protein
MLTNTTDINTYQKHTILLLLFCMSLLTPIQAFSEGIFLGLGDLKGIFPNPKGGISSIAWAVSGDGNVVVGTSNNEAFRWTSGGGMVGLGDGSYANSVSGDGKIVVGYFNSFMPSFAVQRKALASSKTPLLELILLNPTTVLPSLLTPWALELALESRAHQLLGL